MQIDAINTLEIRFVEAPDVFFERRLRVYRARFEAEQGCVSFVVSRASGAEHVWILSGHWTDNTHMTAHFAGANMAELVNFLIGLRAHLSFASFGKVQPGTSADVR
ncbi:putative quinol monooxygenase [Pseudomonas sp. NPDC090202]|uniref:putative quinol monooxygenase n=1 Tax=unclassified Pseudomonas TaxID=196821 RepID=UPI0037F48B71